MKNPEIRFIDDNIDWQNENLSDALIERNTASYKNNGLEHVSLTKDGVIPKSDRYERDFLVTTKNKKYKITKINDICYNPANLKFGVICRNKYKDGIFSPIYITFETTENYSPNFVELLVTNPKFIRASLRYQEGTVYERMAVSPDNLLKMPISIPNIELQDKISKIFEDIDIKIKEEIGLIQKLKDTKSALLIKMFPQENQSVPELRFDDFTNDWEQRKLGDMLKTLKDGTHGTHQDVEIGPLLLSAKNIKSGKVIWDDSDRRISQDSYNKIHSSFKLMKGDVLLTIVGSIGETAILKEPDIMTFQRSVAILSPNDNLFSQFLHTEIQTNKFQRELENRKSTSAQSGIYLGELSEIPIMFPSKEEQTKIGILFQSLDNLITLHQRKLDKLKEVKDALLDKLLV